MRKTFIVSMLFITLCFLFSITSHASASINYDDFRTETDTISFAKSIYADYGIWAGDDQQYLFCDNDQPVAADTMFNAPIGSEQSTVKVIKPTGESAQEFQRIVNSNYGGVSPFGEGGEATNGFFAIVPKDSITAINNTAMLGESSYTLSLKWPTSVPIPEGFTTNEGTGQSQEVYEAVSPYQKYCPKYAPPWSCEGVDAGKKITINGDVYELGPGVQYSWSKQWILYKNGQPKSSYSFVVNSIDYGADSTPKLVAVHRLEQEQYNELFLTCSDATNHFGQGTDKFYYRYQTSPLLVGFNWNSLDFSTRTITKTINIDSSSETLAQALSVLNNTDATQIVVPVSYSDSLMQPSSNPKAVNMPTPYSSISGFGAIDRLSVLSSDDVDTASYIADPINTSSGAHEINKTLLTLNGAQKFSFSVDYNSLLLSTGSLGRGWNHNYEARLSLLQNGNIDLCWNSNRKNHFTDQGNNTYTSTDTATQYDTLTKNQDNTYTLKRKDQNAYLFSEAGKLTEIQNGHGQKLALSYDGQNRLSTVTEPISGKSLTFTYNTDNFIETVTDNLNRQVEFGYDPDGNLINITDANGEATSYSYNASGRVTDALGPDGVTIFHNTYDIEGRVITQEDSDPTNEIVTLSYDETSTPGELTTTVTDRNGHTKVLTHDDKYQLLNIQDELNQTAVTYTYDNNGNQTSSTDALNNTTHYTYDTKGNMTLVVNAKDATTTLTYDDYNNLARIENALGQAVTYTYDTNNNPLTITDPLSNTTSFTYGENGLLLTKTLPRGGTTRYAYTNGLATEVKSTSDNTSTIDYDDAGRITSITDALGHETTTTYDNADNILAVTDPLGHSYSYTYDSFHNKLTKTDPKGNVTGYTYNPNGNLQTVTNALDETTTYEYDGEDRLTGITDALNHTTTLTYDAKGRLISTTDPLNHTTTTEYDALDNITAKKDAYGATILKISYDALNNPITITDALENTTTTNYDILSRIDSVIDPLQRSTTYAYDQAGRLNQSTDALSGVSSQGYDADGNKVSITDPNNNQTVFNYDLAGRLTSQETSSSATSYTYNSVDLINEITNARNQQTTLNYDAAGRVSSITSPEGETTYAYDANNNITQVTDEEGTITRTFDALNRVLTYTDVHGDTISYEYDKAGNLSKLTYPGNKEVDYAYDAANRLTTATDWEDRVTTYEYDNNNRLTKIFRPNSTTLTLTYNTKGELTHQKDEGPGSTVISEYDFTYDAAGQLITETDLVREGTGTPDSVSMTYGTNNRLATFNEETVTVDADGNMTNGSLNGTMQNFAYDSKNRLIQAGETHYTYDAENNRVAVSITGESTQTTLYTVNPNTTYSQTLIKTNPDGSKTYYIYGLDLIAQEDQTGYKTYHFDRRGSTVAIANAAGTVTDEFTYAPFGELTDHTGNTETPFKFNGAYGVMTDSNGLYYMRARYYSPEIKRFINQDVLLGDIGNGQSLNRYAYCNGNPVSLIDPFGLCGKEDGGGSSNSYLKLMYDAYQFLDDLGTSIMISDPIPLVPYDNVATVSWGSQFILMGKAGKFALKVSENTKGFSAEKQALIDMAKKDKRTGITPEDMQTYKDLNKELPDPFPSKKVHGPEIHPNRNYKDLHGHVGPVNHIPIKEN